MNKNKIIIRTPVVAIMGHVDHGKSTLLDYIRRSNIVAGESGGITQHIGAYEVLHETQSGDLKKITFLDTPGHAAFTSMRTRGASAADIAILVVSAEDGVKAQTLEALSAIKDSGVPYIVAINKIDKPGANIERTKTMLAENGVYLEGMGGEVPFVAISAKTGEGIHDLLDLILFVADFHEMRSDLSKKAEGLVLESHRDPKRGISSTLIIKDGTLKKGEFIVAGTSIVNTRMMENFMGKSMNEGYASSPVNLTGWDSMPPVGDIWNVYDNKKDAEKAVEKNKEKVISGNRLGENTRAFAIPIIIKADVVGSLEAIEKELGKISNEEIGFKIIHTGVGNISENDLRLAMTDKNCIVIGLHTGIEKNAEDIKQQNNITVMLFDIIYKLTEYMEEELEKRRPRKEVTEVTGSIKILKIFGQSKEKQVIGARVLTGSVVLGAHVKILRRENEIGTAKVTELQHNKAKTKEVFEGDEFGMQVETKITLAIGDMLEATKVTNV